jgi:hypothetical protein
VAAFASQLARLKTAFVPPGGMMGDPSMGGMPPGAPPMDPAAMGGAPPTDGLASAPLPADPNAPMDPAMMAGAMPPGGDPAMMAGAMPPGGDPAAMGGDPAAMGAPAPEAPPAPPADPAAGDPDVGSRLKMLEEKLQQFLDNGGKPKKVTPEDLAAQIKTIGSNLDTVMSTLGLSPTPMPEPTGAGTGSAGSSSSGRSGDGESTPAAKAAAFVNAGGVGRPTAAPIIGPRSFSDLASNLARAMAGR